MGREEYGQEGYMGHFRGLDDVLSLKLGGGYTQFVTSLYTAYKCYKRSLRKHQKSKEERKRYSMWEKHNSSHIRPVSS